MMVSTGEVTNVLTNSADIAGSVIDLGDGGVSEHGHCYAKTPNVSINSTRTSLGTPSGKGGFTSQLSNLDAGTKYYIKAYLSNGKEVVYGKEINFSTAQALLPDITTTAVTDITQKGAVSGGNITNDGGAPVTVRGVCWSNSTNPTTNNFKTSDGSGTGSFSSSLADLSVSTTYYVRAYATNSTGTGYGNEVSFISAAAPVIPPVTTNAVTTITSNSAISGGSIRNDGGAPVTGRGVCWNTAGNPTIADFITADGTGTGSFISNLTGLSSGVTYYIRAYAINNVGTSYGNELSFTTNPGIPVLTTKGIESITGTTAISGGNITSDGGATITERGICWSTNTNPTISNSKTTNGIGSGSFTSNLTGLSPVTTYYVRAYAINSIGTAYGNQLSFTTSQWIPTLTTTPVTMITSGSAVSGGNITSDGGATVTERGVCWNTSVNPTTANFKTIDGSGTGSFTSNIAGINPGTLYYIRSYATNSTGTAYGNELSFTSSAVMPSLTTIPLSSISGTTAVSGGNITTDGGAAITARGVCWSTSQNPTIAGNHSSDGIGTGIFSSNITGLSPLTKYYVRAYATNSTGTAYGDELSFTTISENPPATPTSMCALPSMNRITIKWDEAEGASNYVLYWSTNPGVSKTYYTGKITDIDTTYYVHSGLLSGTSYYYIVTGKNYYGESDASEEAKGTPPLIQQKNTVSNTGEKHFYQVSVPAGQSLFVNVNTADKNNNFYLYIKYGAIPSITDYDTLSATGADEAISVTNTQAGTYYIMVFASYYHYYYSGPASGDYTITATTSVTSLTFGTTMAGIMYHQEEKHYYEVSVTSGQSFFVNTHNSDNANDVYLYIRYGSLPTTTVYDAKSETGDDEAVGITNSQPGRYFIMVYVSYYHYYYSGPAAGDYTIKAVK